MVQNRRTSAANPVTCQVAIKRRSRLVRIICAVHTLINALLHIRSRAVFTAQLILVLLVGITPIMLFTDGPIVHGIVAGLAAAGIAVVSATMRPGETQFLVSLLRRAALFAAIPILWIVFQLVPLGPIANPIWSSAEAALGHPLYGSISIDFGASVMALGFYLSAAGVALLAAAVAVERQRAVWVLFALVGATVVIALILLTEAVGRWGGSDLAGAVSERAQAIDCAAIGAIVAAAAGVRTLERNASLPRQQRSITALLLTYTALVICALALFFGSANAVMLAAGYGVGVVIIVAVVRRLGLGPLGLAAAAVLAIGAAGLLIASEPGLRTKGLALAFAVPSPAALISASQRALNDARWLGTGAGTFAALMPIYREINQPAMSSPPTAVVALAIELGWPVVVLIVAAALAVIFILLRASLQRGRDSFYPAAGAGVLISLLLLAFINAGMLGTAAVVLISTTLGLALAQRKGRTM